jgi:uncharacterized protein
MEFEWHEAKRAANLAKHGIDFIDAIQIWVKLVIDPADSRVVGSEPRHTALGVIGDKQLVIAVIYTDRTDVRRIISARRARRNERAIYASIFGKSG